MYPSAKWYRSEMTSINGKDVGVIELLTPAIDTKIYNLICFSVVDGKILILTFNCTEEEMDDWTLTGQQILDSFQVQ